MQKIAERLIPRIAWIYLNLVGKTSKILWLNSQKLINYKAKYGNVIYALWHGRQFFFPYAYRNQSAAVIVSRSKDGEYIARTMNLFGMKAVRGSSSRGGMRGLIQLKNEYLSGMTVGVTPDGPKGPLKKVSFGILFLAKKTGRPILPITYSSKYKLIFRGWDEYWVPLPFSQILINFGNPVFVGADDNLSTKAYELEKELNRITEEADNTFRDENISSLRVSGLLYECSTPPNISGIIQESFFEKLFYFTYTTCFILAAPLFIFSFLLKYKGFFFQNFFQGLQERLGKIHVPAHTLLKNTIWIHAASLGETRAAAPLSIALRKKYHSSSIVFSTSTVTGIEEAKKLQLADFYFFAPIDLPLILKNVFRIIQPKLLLLLESELWPNWLRIAKTSAWTACSERSGGAESHAWTAESSVCRIAIVNGRMSKKSSGRYAKLGWLSKLILNKIDCVCAREQGDAESFDQAGIPKDRIKITGNLKFDWLPWQINSSTIQPNTKSDLKHVYQGSIILTAGSVRKGEEKLLLESYLRLKNKYPDLKLILAPRHLASLSENENLLQAKGISFCRKSLLTNNDGLWTVDCILWDTFGNLWEAYQIATIVFVGGSLVPKGGQNPIEPAWFEKPVLFGPHMENFAEPAKLLMNAHGAIQVKDASELSSKIDELLADPEQMHLIGKNARKCVETFFNQATHKTMEIISALY